MILSLLRIPCNYMYECWIFHIDFICDAGVVTKSPTVRLHLCRGPSLLQNGFSRSRHSTMSNCSCSTWCWYMLIQRISIRQALPRSFATGTCCVLYGRFFPLRTQQWIHWCGRRLIVEHPLRCIRDSFRLVSMVWWVCQRFRDHDAPWWPSQVPLFYLKSSFLGMKSWNWSSHTATPSTSGSFGKTNGVWAWRQFSRKETAQTISIAMLSCPPKHAKTMTATLKYVRIHHLSSWFHVGCFAWFCCYVWLQELLFDSLLGIDSMVFWFTSLNVIPQPYVRIFYIF